MAGAAVGAGIAGAGALALKSKKKGSAMRLSEVHKGPHPAAKKYLVARAARDLAPKTELPKGRIFRTPHGMVKVQPTAGGGVMVTHPDGRVEHIKDRTALSRIGKSFVAGGAARKITELSPRARDVLRRNLAGERAVRAGVVKPRVGFLGTVTDMPHTRPPSHMQRKLDEINSYREGGKRLLDPSPVSGKVRPTRVRNVGVEDSDKLSRENAATLSRSLKDAQRGGLKFRKPVVVRAGADIGRKAGGTAGVEAIGRTAGETRDHGPVKTITFAGKKIDGFNATHELWHASGKPNRLIQQKFRRMPKRTAVREEAGADAFASRMKRKRLDSGSGYAVGATPGGEYDKTFASARGRKVRVPFRAKLKSTFEAQQGPKVKRIDVGSAIRGGRAGRDRDQRYNRMYFERKRLKGV